MLTNNDRPGAGSEGNAAAIQLTQGDGFICSCCEQDEEPINVNEAVCYLHALIRHHLLGPGPWPLDEEPATELLDIIDELVESAGALQVEALGRECPLDLMMVFGGCWDLPDIPAILANYDCITWDEAQALGDLRDPEYQRELHSILGRAYRSFCSDPKWEIVPMNAAASSSSAECSAGEADANPASAGKAETIRKLHAIADHRLTQSGAWPADAESCAAFSMMARELGLDEDMPGCEGMTRWTPLGIELQMDLMTVFAGCWELYEVPHILAHRGYIDWNELDEIFELPDREFEQKIHSLVLQAYRQFCGHSTWLIERGSIFAAQPVEIGAGSETTP